MLEVFKDFEPAVLKLLAMADEETLKVWELLDMESLPTWTADKLVLIGDAAHPFTPHQGQGAGQAMEDAASLAVMLSSDTTLDSIPARLKLYEKCRYERASHIQEISRIAGQDLGSEPPVDNVRFTAYNFGHDEWDASIQVLRKWKWEQNETLLWKMPTSFGPMPGPQQEVQGRPKAEMHATFSTASIKFKTSRTVLQNLLPAGKLRFAAPDTVAYATFSVTQFGNMESLGGKGYSQFGLYIHGVQYAKGNGDTVTGTYLPILFENLVDASLAKQDEVGFPKVFAELDIKRDGARFVLDAEWMGSKFCTMTLEGLDSPAADEKAVSELFPPLPKDEGLLFTKYFPGRCGNQERSHPDVDYTVFLPSSEGAKKAQSTFLTSQTASSAAIGFDALDPNALPTLHHIVDRLAEIPVFSVIEAKLMEGTGVSDFNTMRRVGL